MAERTAADSEVWATVVIPTYNGADYLDGVLTAIASQEREGQVEVLVIDSGSTDGSLDIINSHAGVRLVEIPNSEFGHGRTRDHAARMARGTYIAFLSQDAIPAHTRWLRELLLPFTYDDRVAIVTGRQIPRRHAFPLLKYEIVGVFRALGPDTAVSIFGGWPYEPSEAELAAASFHSDVNAAVRRSRVTSDLSFRDVPYAEDQMMGRDVLGAGALKAYAGRAAVIHSNDLTRKEYGQRIFDETVGLRRIGTPIPRMSRVAQVRLTVRGVIGDGIRIMRDGDFGAAERLRWLLVNPSYQVRKWAAYRRASLVDLADDSRIAASSLEARRKKG